jgi:hypothetical protein
MSYVQTGWSAPPPTQSWTDKLWASLTQAVTPTPPPIDPLELIRAGLKPGTDAAKQYAAAKAAGKQYDPKKYAKASDVYVPPVAPFRTTPGGAGVKTAGIGNLPTYALLGGAALLGVFLLTGKRGASKPARRRRRR